jgi:diguanylate cyclase (GGDEF)-like protein
MDYGKKFISLHQSLMALCHTEGFLDRDFNTKLRIITRACTEQLGVARASVWSINDTRDSIYCEMLYIAGAHEYEQGLRLSADNFPAYFKAINEDRIIDAGDAHLDPRTCEFSDNYLTPLNIAALLDAPIFFGGKLYGVLCIEDCGSARPWDVAEMSYAAAAADTISLFNEYESWLSTHTKLRYLESTDRLTGLENRHNLQQRIECDIESLGATSAARGLLLLGLDGFTAINDLYGQQQGDYVLCQVAYRLRLVAQQCGAHLARVAGDEFALWLPESVSAEKIQTTLNALANVFEEPFNGPADTLLPLTASTGAVLYPQPEQRISDPIHCAELAMRSAKAQAAGSISHFLPEWMTQLTASNALKAELLHALDSGQLVAFYQPIVSADNCGEVGLEALVRWQHPEKGLRPPGLFLPLLAEMGLMSRLGDLMLHQACSDLSDLRARGFKVGWVSVNIAAEQLYSTTLVAQVSALLKTFNLPGRCLELEIVEELISLESELLCSQLTGLGKLGVGLAIDDFGTGYSSLSRLKLLPVNKLKIDKSFVDGLPLDEGDQCITRSIIGLALGMGLQLVAEGVELEAQAQWLREQGCEYLQGYLFAKPMPISELEDFLNARRAL